LGPGEKVFRHFKDRSSDRNPNVGPVRSYARARASTTRHSPRLAIQPSQAIDQTGQFTKRGNSPNGANCYPGQRERPAFGCCVPSRCLAVAKQVGTPFERQASAKQCG
jgi:hypothetical protein